MIHVVIPIIIVGSAYWITFHMACQAEKTIRQPILDVVERVGGFILAAMAVEMMAAGLRALFPCLPRARKIRRVHSRHPTWVLLF